MQNILVEYEIIVVHNVQIFESKLANTRDERGTTTSKKPMLKRVLIGVSSAIPCFYVIAVLFGAPFFSHFVATFTFAIVLSLICVLPIAIVIRNYDDLDSVIFDNNPSTGSQLIAHRIALGGLVGAWLGAFVIPLDWDRWWQRWPLPCIFGAFFGATIGSLVAVVECGIRRKRLRKKKTSKSS